MADAQAAATMRLELEAASEAAGDLEGRVNEARRAIVASYVATFGGEGEPATSGPELRAFLRTAEAAIIDALQDGGESAAVLIQRYAQRASQLGTEHAAEVVAEAGVLDAPEPRGSAGASATRAVDEARSAALRLLAPSTLLGAGFAGALAVVGAASKGVNGVRATARTAVNATRNEAVHEVAERHGYGRVWVAERDGCVHCLAYAGEVAYEGQEFPVGLTFGDKPLKQAPQSTRQGFQLKPASTLPDPPLHPNCRCEVMPYKGTDGPTFPDALKREARRSIAKGWRVESESEAVRLRAAESLLKRGADLPQSVQDGASRALARGKFPTRRVPRGTAT